MDRRYIAAMFVLLFAVLACAYSGPTPAAPGTLVVTHTAFVTPPVTPEFVPTAFPITPTYEGCAFVWGTKDLPELSRKFNAELQAISMDAGGMAYAYGENCIYGDGHQTFGAMETDYRVGITVRSVADENALGNWILKVMQVVEGLPADQVEGPQPGRVDFTFKQPDPAEVFVSVPIDKYRSQARGLKGAELFRFFYTKP